MISTLPRRLPTIPLRNRKECLVIEAQEELVYNDTRRKNSGGYFIWEREDGEMEQKSRLTTLCYMRGRI